MKMFYVCLLMFAMLNVFGALQYEPEYAYKDYIKLKSVGNNPNITFVEDSWLSLKFSDDVTVTDLFNSMNVTITQDGISETKDIEITNNSIDLGSFTKGTTITINQLSGSYDSTKVGFGDRGDWMYAGENTYDGYNILFALEGHYDLSNKPNQYYQYNFKFSNQQPVGQPLPGVVASMLVGAAGVAFGKFRKKRI